MPNPKRIVLISPFLITAINVIVAFSFGEIIGKWAFIPIILIEWILFMFFVLKYGDGKNSIKKWLQKTERFYYLVNSCSLNGTNYIAIFFNAPRDFNPLDNLASLDFTCFNKPVDRGILLSWIFIGQHN